MLCLSFWPFWGVVLRGFPDIASLIFVLVCALVCSLKDLSVKLTFKYILILGISFWLIFLFRRWYAYTLLSIFISLPTLNYFLFNRKFNTKRIKTLLLNFSSSFIVFFLLIVVFQYKLFKRIVGTDYSHIYSAYQYSFKSSILSFTNHLGLIFVILSIILLSFAVKFFNRERKIFTVFYIFNLFFTFFAFTRTQGPRMQHLLPLELWVLLSTTLSAFVLTSRIKEVFKRNFVYILFLSFNVFLLIFASTGFQVPSELRKIMPYKREPLTLSNINSYNSLVAYLDNLCGNGDKFSILASSTVLNDEILNSLSFYKLQKKIQHVSHVDLRDGLNVNFLTSKYLVITDPVQTHLPKGTQVVISIPVQELLRSTTIGKYYKKIGGPYILENGVKAYIFEKNKPITEKTFKEFLNKFYDVYPSWKKAYSAPLLHVFSTSSSRLGDKWGRFYFNKDGNIEAHPGDNLPTIVNWDLTNIDSLKISSVNLKCNIDDPVLIRLHGANYDSGILVLKKGSSLTLDTKPLKGSYSELTISKNKSSGCDGIVISTSPKI